MSLFGGLFGGKSGQQADPEHPDRLPPGQYLTKKWPVLSYESTPRFDPAAYRFKVWGTVEQPFELTWDELRALPRTQLTTDIHCVTTWSRYDNAWEGIPVRAIIERAKPTADTQFVVAHSWTGYTTNLPYSDFAADDVLIAFNHDGAEIEAEHGGPVRLMVPRLYFYKSAKWLSGIEFLAKDRPGFWEVRGYHNHADPWQEERYW
ncbi:MAG TPA: sulfite oxidase-like oxidoreductase [Ktedonobacterales bacterium]|jgi:DMSO/TMAO reductase YedYZ molybdopterin-dependent catalytic subunit|nr:sulfite oxidase-like oxidoreductase [Ktedonobacterales bacterium]